MESRRSYGWGYVGEQATGYDWKIQKNGDSLIGGTPHRTKEDAIKAAKKFLRESNKIGDWWNGAKIEVIKYKCEYGY